MTVAFWILLLLTLGLGAWGVNHYRSQSHRIGRLKASLENANKQLQAGEGKHEEASAQWEKDHAKLRSYLKLMDTLINTIPNGVADVW